MSDRTTATTKRKQAFGAALLEARNVRGVLQSELAAAVDTVQSAVSEWEKGEKQPPPETVFAVEEFLELPPGHLSQHLGYAPVDAGEIPPTFEQAVMAEPLLGEAEKRGILALYKEFTSSKKPTSARRRARR